MLWAMLVRSFVRLFGDTQCSRRAFVCSCRAATFIVVAVMVVVVVVGVAVVAAATAHTKYRALPLWPFAVNNNHRRD